MNYKPLQMAGWLRGFIVTNTKHHDISKEFCTKMRKLVN